MKFRVVDLPTLIMLKRACGRPRDLAMLPILEATLRERVGSRVAPNNALH